jgi:hypothetical protein
MYGKFRGYDKRVILTAVKEALIKGGQSTYFDTKVLSMLRLDEIKAFAQNLNMKDVQALNRISNLARSSEPPQRSEFVDVVSQIVAANPTARGSRSMLRFMQFPDGRKLQLLTFGSDEQDNLRRGVRIDFTNPDGKLGDSWRIEGYGNEFYEVYFNNGVAEVEISSKVLQNLADHIYGELLENIVSSPTSLVVAKKTESVQTGDRENEVLERSDGDRVYVDESKLNKIGQLRSRLFRNLAQQAITVGRRILTTKVEEAAEPLLGPAMQETKLLPEAPIDLNRPNGVVYKDESS